MRRWFVLLTSLGVSCSPVVPQPTNDAGFDVTVEAAACETPEDCDDGIFCNGSESCVNGTCTSDPRVCDDGIACTQDSCSEERAACVSRPVDQDRDGYGSSSCVDQTGAPLGIDCDDADPDRFPGNLEVCDLEGHDEDCDPQTLGSTDLDDDGYTDARCCNAQPGGSTLCGDDCDDARVAVNRRGTEVCNAIDDDCDGTTDEDLLGATLYRDDDGDGHGDPDVSISSCGSQSGYSLLNDDCDDANPRIHGGQVEVCDTLDNNCDDLVDNDAQIVTWYRDGDGDGFGVAGAGNTQESCEPPTGYSLLSTDCDDTSGTVNPGATERCNGIDDDCNGSANYVISAGNFEDDDGDRVADLGCSGGTDCDDRDPSTAPGFSERCDGRDNDCDALVDENARSAVWYLDTDGDSYGSPTSGAEVSCDPLLGYVSRAGDCDDARDDISPNAPELCDALDNNCNGAIDDGDLSAMCTRSNAVGRCISGNCAIASCAAGFADCDGAEANGCEADFATDDNNCGRCGTSCDDLPNTEQTVCESGVCTIESCATGYGNCDGSLANGCETDTQNSVAHCGTCGNTCSSINGAPYCAAGTCNISCRANFGDCTPSPGCETNLTDQANCGGCGNILPDAYDCTVSAVEHTVSTSCGPSGSAYVCHVQCQNDYGDCNGLGPDGCEASFATDINNCGRCGEQCSTSRFNVQSVNGCSAGHCLFTCFGGWGDCDGNAFNGCETNLNSPDNCGTCGMVCSPGQACNAGTCGMGGGGAPLTNVFFEVGTGSQHGCALIGGNRIACWGNNNVGQLGDGTTNPSSTPRLVRYDTGAQVANFFSGLHTGSLHNCATSMSGDVWCWGSDLLGQLGNGPGATANADRAQAVGLSMVSQLATGANHSCAVTPAGIFCWGDNSMAQCGLSATQMIQSAPVTSVNTSMIQASLGPAFHTRQLALGSTFSCGWFSDMTMTNSEVWCWGRMPSVTGLQIATANPVLVALGQPGCAPSNPITGLAAGSDHVCMQVDDNSMPRTACFGENAQGQLLIMNDNTTLGSCPRSGSYTGSPLLLGDGVSCFFEGSGGISCVGRNTDRQLGQISVNSDPTFMNKVTVTGLTGLTLGGRPALGSASGSQICAAESNNVGGNNRLYCWGRNQEGQLGRGSMSPVEHPGFVINAN